MYTELSVVIRQLGEGNSEKKPLDLRLASAVLLVEIACVDHEYAPQEKDVIRQALAEDYALQPEEVEQLLTQASQILRDTAVVRPFAAFLKEALPDAQKQRLLAELWSVVYADGRVDPDEHRMLHTLCRHLGMTQDDLLAAKAAAREL